LRREKREERGGRERNKKKGRDGANTPSKISFWLLRPWWRRTAVHG